MICFYLLQVPTLSLVLWSNSKIMYIDRVLLAIFISALVSSVFALQRILPKTAAYDHTCAGLVISGSVCPLACFFHILFFYPVLSSSYRFRNYNTEKVCEYFDPIGDTIFFHFYQCLGSLHYSLTLCGVDSTRLSMSSGGKVPQSGQSENGDGSEDLGGHDGLEKFSLRGDRYYITGKVGFQDSEDDTSDEYQLRLIPICYGMPILSSVHTPSNRKLNNSTFSRFRLTVMRPSLYKIEIYH